MKSWIPLISLAICLAGCGSGNAGTSADAGKTAPEEKPALNSMNATSKSSTPAPAPATASVDKLVSEDLKVGTGIEVKPGDLAVVLYKGTLTDGKTFDDNLAPDKDPFVFKVGAGMVIKGWDQGVAGMKIGGKRKLTIPASLGYGEAGQGPIPPNATLVFEVQLLEVIQAGKEAEYTKKITKEGSGAPAKKGDTITVHYTGRLVNGKKFDSSRDRNQPFSFQLGAGGVIKGWDFGLVGIKKGERRIMRIMPGAAYGEAGNSGIGPNQPLEFDIECLDIKRS